jgi:hypothetical protein
VRRTFFFLLLFLLLFSRLMFVCLPFGDPCGVLALDLVLARGRLVVVPELTARVSFLRIE